jgi:carboxylesterase
MIVSAPVLTGHGTKPKDLIGVPWTRWVEDSRRVVLELKSQCDELFMIGFSMGGTIALLLSTEFECSGIITLSAPIGIKKPWVRLLPLYRPFIRYWKKRCDSHSMPLLPEMGYDRYPIEALSEFLKLLQYVRNHLPRVARPILIMHARGDRVVPTDNADQIYQSVSSSDKKKIILDDPCHMITRGKDQDRIHQEIDRFIQAHSTSCSP